MLFVPEFVQSIDLLNFDVVGDDDVKEEEEGR